MPTRKYLLIHRSAPGAQPPSPAQMQEMYRRLQRLEGEVQGQHPGHGRQARPAARS